MTQKKPACSAFIVAAIRTIRRSPSARMHSDTAMGVRMSDVFALAQQAYTMLEFERGLRKLIRSAEVLLVWELRDRYWGEEDGRKVLHFGTIDRRECVKYLPIGVDFRIPRWHFDAAFVPVDEKSANVRWFARNRMLYVVSDGLPQSIRKIADQTRGLHKVSAASIIAKMTVQRENPRSRSKKRATR